MIRSPHDERSQIMVDALELTGAAAAIVDGDGRPRAANRLFLSRLAGRAAATPGGLRFVDRRLADRLRVALERLRDHGTTQSWAIGADGDVPPCALHLLPVRGAARGWAAQDDVLLLAARAGAAAAPAADLLRSAFGLTPMEASVARTLFAGGSPATAAAELGVGEGTVRTHLKAVFAKTGVGRQVDLVRLLAPLAPPPDGECRNETNGRSPPNGRGGDGDRNFNVASGRG